MSSSSRTCAHYKGQSVGTSSPCNPTRCSGWDRSWPGGTRPPGPAASATPTPRSRAKNARKSLEAATMAALSDVLRPGAQRAEGYCVATKRDQAKLVFNDAKRLVVTSKLRRHVRVLVANLHQERMAQKLEPLGADEDSLDGLNAHFVCLDEMHAYKTRGKIDVLETSTGARRQPLIFKITTAGDDPVSPLQGTNTRVRLPDPGRGPW